MIPLPLLPIVATVSQAGFTLSPPWVWFSLGTTLCLTEFFLGRKLPRGYRLIALMLGISALIVWMILWRSSVHMGILWQYVMYEGFSLQIMYWMGVSMALTIWIRPIFLLRKQHRQMDAAEAMTLTAILPETGGRVMYEGSSWQASCDKFHGAIAANQKVYVLRREGNTLIVIPEEVLHS